MSVLGTGRVCQAARAIMTPAQQRQMDDLLASSNPMTDLFEDPILSSMSAHDILGGELDLSMMNEQ